MRLVRWLPTLWMLVACSPTEGPLLSSETISGSGGMGGETGSVPEPPDPPAEPPLEPDSPVVPGMTFQYQLSGSLDMDVDAELVIVDLFQTSAEQVAEFHERERVVLAYLSAGTLENFRDDAELFPEEAVGEPYPSYPNEAWLDPRHSEVRTLMAARLDRALDKGFDGVLPSNLNAYREESGFELTAADQLDYTRWLAEQARARGLTVGMSGDYRHADELVDVFEWAIHFECIRRSDCASLSPFQERGKPVFDVEYEGELETICQEAERLGLVAILKQPSLNAYREACP